MPQYLRAESLRLLESATESFALALSGLGTPPRKEFRDPASQFAPVIGLIGAALEQTMSAVLIQVHGNDVVFRVIKGHDGIETRRYKSFQEILDDLRVSLRKNVPRVNFLTAGVEDPAAHLKNLLEQINTFSVLGTLRAVGLHAGKGPSREVAYHTALKVYEFLKSLSKSKKVRPYLDAIPIPAQPPESANILIEDLARKLAKTDAKDVEARANLLSSIYLVLPFIPDQEPEWLAALDRVAVVPVDRDLNLLLTTLERAIPVQLQKLSANAKEALSMAVRPNDPAAVPVAPHDVRRQLTHINEQFMSDIGLANGRLQEGSIDLPPEDFPRKLFCLGREGLEAALRKSDQNPLTAQEAWPFVMIAIRARGIETPYWFLVRMVADLGQLRAHVGKAMELVKGEAKSSRARHKKFLEGLNSMDTKKPLSPSSVLKREIDSLQKEMSTVQSKLISALERTQGQVHGLTVAGEAAVTAILDGWASLDQILPQVLVATTNPDKGNPYWTQMLCQSASNLKDVQACCDVLADNSLLRAHTDARRALHRLDLVFFGPGLVAQSD